MILTVEDILPVAKPPKVRIEAINGQNNTSNSPIECSSQAWKERLEEYPQSGGGVLDQLANTKTPRQSMTATPQEGNLEKQKISGYYTFTAICDTSEKIENYAWKIIDKKTNEIVDSTSLNKENTFEKALKKGNYQIITEVVDENGLSGKDEIEVMVS